MRPVRTDRISQERQEEIARHVVVVIHIMCYSHIQMSNWLQRNLAGSLHYFDINDVGLHTLHPMGLGFGLGKFYTHIHESSLQLSQHINNIIQKGLQKEQLMGDH